MLNLQTIVEDLGLECGGKAWVIVTSQEAIDDVVKVQGNDFSKFKVDLIQNFLYQVLI